MLCESVQIDGCRPRAPLASSKRAREQGWLLASLGSSLVYNPQSTVEAGVGAPTRRCAVISWGGESGAKTPRQTRRADA